MCSVAKGHTLGCSWVIANPSILLLIVPYFHDGSIGIGDIQFFLMLIAYSYGIVLAACVRLGIIIIIYSEVEGFLVLRKTSLPISFTLAGSVKGSNFSQLKNAKLPILINFEPSAN